MKDCENERHCPLCEKEGHSEGIGARPVTRRALGRARREAETREKETSAKRVEDDDMEVEEGTERSINASEITAPAMVVDITRTPTEQR